MRVLSVFAVAGWLAIVAAGFYRLSVYESTPGNVGEVSHRWPSDSRLALDPKRWTLLMFLHPHCPCSKASLQVLDDLSTTHSRDMHVRLVFCMPQGVPGGWEQSDTWRQAAAMKGIDVTSDEGDVERRKFGALTSGEALLYGPDGTLKFRGGLTPARGWQGPSLGRHIIDTLLGGHQPANHEAPVFGCPLTSG